jgi:tetratricopeptide (TPR) repeat protein
MDSGSIEEVSERLKLWCLRHESGLARVDWDSAHARQEVVTRLREALAGSHIPVEEISLPPGEEPHITVSRLIEKLRSHTGSAVSITDIEWAFPQGGSRLDTLAALNFQRETLASLPVHQIWWVPSHLVELFVLGIPDLESWFRIRLRLTEIPSPDPAMRAAPTPPEAVDIEGARALARRFWERFENARAQGMPDSRIWTELAEPAIRALRAAGIEDEIDVILSRAPDGRQQLEHDIREAAESYGTDDSRVLDMMLRLARVNTYRGDFAAARELEERVLESRNRQLGPDDPKTLWAMGNLAETLRVQGDLAGARRLQETVLEARTRLFGGDHPDALIAAGNLAITLWNQGDLSGAQRLEQQVLAARRRTLGTDHPDTIQALGNLAVTLQGQRDFAGSRRLLEQVLEARSRILGSEHPDTLRAASNLAYVIGDLGELQDARKRLEGVLEVSRRVLGEDHPDTLSIIGNLVETLNKLGDIEDARKLCEELLEGRKRALGPNHPDTIAAAEFLKTLMAPR